MLSNHRYVQNNVSNSLIEPSLTALGGQALFETLLPNVSEAGTVVISLEITDEIRRDRR